MAYNKREHHIIFKVIPALHLKQEKCWAVLNPLANGTNYFTSNNNNASNAVQPSQLGKLNTEPLINKETTAARLDKNSALLEALTEESVHKGTTVLLHKDRACNTKIDTILEEDSNKEKDNDAAKSKDDKINTPAALEKCMNFAATVEENKDGLYFQVINLVAGHTKRNHRYC